MLQDELASALNITKSQLTKWKAKGCPVDDAGKAKTWIAANIKTRAKRKPSVVIAGDKPEQTPSPVECSNPDDITSPEARLERAKQMELLLDATVKQAVGKKEFGSMQSLLSSYQRAFQTIQEGEERQTAARLASAELIHRDTAQAIYAEMFVPLRNALELLPVTVRSRCNPQKPEVAEKALREWKDALLLKLSTARLSFN